MQNETVLQHLTPVDVQPENYPLVFPIYQSVKFHSESLEDLAGNKSPHYVYSRVQNPTLEHLERALAQIQNRESCYVVASGVAAISSALLCLLKSGDHVITFIESYRPTRFLIFDLLKNFGVDATLLSISELDQVESAVRPGKTRMILFEVPSNPMCRIPDIQALTSIAQKYQLLTIADTTLAGFHQLRETQIDLFLHSLTKFASGHGDVMGGALIGSQALISKIRTIAMHIGPTLDPHAAFLILRGLKTYFLRYEKHSHNAQKIAEWLERQPQVERVFYPGLRSHPDHEMAYKYLKHMGSVVSFSLKPEGPTISEVIRRMQLFHLAPSLGSTDSLVAPALQFFGSDLSPEDRKKSMMNERTLRLSVGLEDPDDLIQDLRQALQK